MFSGKHDIHVNRTKKAPARVFALALLFGLAAGAPAEAAETIFIGAFGEWEAFHAGDGKTKICYMASTPISDKGKYKKRGPIQFFVTHQPAAKIKHEINIVNGYDFRNKSTVTVHISRKRFSLFTRGDSAWAKSTKTESEMVTAMQKRSRMIVYGRSNRGTRTRDTYSLSGFSAAYDAITKECGV